MTFKHWRHYFKDLTHSVKVLSDHVNLRFFIITKHLNWHQTWWAEVLSTYDFVLLHQSNKLNLTDVFSCHTDYVNFYHSKILLLILQQKLHHRIQENWKFEINNVEKTLLVCIRVHDFSLKCTKNEKCSLYWCTVRQALSNWSEDVMRLISVSVFQSIVRVVTTLKTVYNDSSESFTQLISKLQVCDS